MRSNSSRMRTTSTVVKKPKNVFLIFFFFFNFGFGKTSTPKWEKVHFKIKMFYKLYFLKLLVLQNLNPDKVTWKSFLLN